MDLIVALLGGLCVLLAILGFAGLIAMTLPVEIVLAFLGIVLLAYCGRGRFVRR